MISLHCWSIGAPLTAEFQLTHWSPSDYRVSLKALKHKSIAYRAVQNDCWCFNNVSYKCTWDRNISLVSLMDPEYSTFSFMICSVYCATGMHFSTWKYNLIKWGRMAMRRCYVCLHFTNICQLQVSSGNAAPNMRKNHTIWQFHSKVVSTVSRNRIRKSLTIEQQLKSVREANWAHIAPVMCITNTQLFY